MLVPYLLKIKPRPVELFLQERQATSMCDCGRCGTEVLVRGNNEGGRGDFMIPVDNSILGFFLCASRWQVVKKRFIRCFVELSIGDDCFDFITFIDLVDYISDERWRIN